MQYQRSRLSSVKFAKEYGLPSSSLEKWVKDYKTGKLRYDGYSPLKTYERPAEINEWYQEFPYEQR